MSGFTLQDLSAVEAEFYSQARLPKIGEEIPIPVVQGLLRDEYNCLLERLAFQCPTAVLPTPRIWLRFAPALRIEIIWEA